MGVDARLTSEAIEVARYRLALVRELRRQALAIGPKERLEWFEAWVAQAHLFPASPHRERVVRELLAEVLKRERERSCMPVMAALISQENLARFALEAAEGDAKGAPT